MMSSDIPNVLFIGDSRKMKGGISTVIRTLERSYLWKKYSCDWLQCQINGHICLKLLYLLQGYIVALFKIPFYNIAFFHTAVGNSMLVQLPIYLYARFLRKHIIVELHVGNQICNYLHNRLFQYWIKHSNLILTLGQVWRDLLLSEEWVKTSVEYIYNPAPEVLTPNSPQKYFLFAAYFDPNKGYDSLISAFARVLKQHSDWKLVLCGTGNLDDVMHTIKKYGISNSVELPGWVEGKRKLTLFRNAYAYCMTSEKEGLPMSVLEAMSYGVPVISTYAGCLPELLEDDKTALMYNFADVATLADKMNSLIENKQLRSILVSNAQKVVHDFLSLELYLKKMETLINSVAKNNLIC